MTLAISRPARKYDMTAKIGVVGVYLHGIQIHLVVWVDLKTQALRMVELIFDESSRHGAKLGNIGRFAHFFLLIDLAAAGFSGWPTAFA